MNAKEARQRAERVNTSTDNAAISTIETLIKAKSAEGKFSIEFQGEISNTVKKYFEDLGYGIGTISTGINEWSYLISW